MRSVIFVTNSLYPLHWDEAALGTWWRARAAALEGTKVTVLFHPGTPQDQNQLRQAQQWYARAGITLVYSPFTNQGLAEDIKIGTGSEAFAGVLLQYRLEKLLASSSPNEVHLVIKGGLPLRILQARQAGLAFTEVDFALHIDSSELADRFLQQKRSTSVWELKGEFAELECIRLAPRLITADLRFRQFLNETFHWPVESAEVLPFVLPEAVESPAEKRRVAALISTTDQGNFQNAFLGARQLVGPQAPSRWWWIAHPSVSPSRKLLQQRKLILRQPNDAVQLQAMLRQAGATVVAPTPWLSARLAWLTVRGIPFVHEEGLHLSWPALETTHRPYAFRILEPPSMLEALRMRWGTERASRLPPPSPATESGPSTTPAPRIELVENLQTPITLAVSHYNLRGMLSETLEALHRQTYRHARTVVVDDGSDDPASLEDWRACKQRYPEMEFVELPHEGYWKPRNHVIFTTPDPLIAIVDGDNIPLPDMAEQFVRAMERNPRTDVFSCYITSFLHETEPGKNRVFRATHCPLGADPVTGFLHNIFGDTNCVFRTEAIRQAGGFRADFKNPYADWDLHLRLMARGSRLDVIPKVLLHYRSHPNSMIRNSNPFHSQFELLSKHAIPDFVLSKPDALRLTMALHRLQNAG